MSVSLWRWSEKCEGKPCCGDCDECGEEDGRGVGMIKEVYRLTLTHYAVDDDLTKTPLDEPIVIEHVFDRRFGGSPIILNRMIDEMERVLFAKKEEVME